VGACLVVVTLAIASWLLRSGQAPEMELTPTAECEAAA